MTGLNSFYSPGDWNAVCEICGFQYKSSEMRKMWTGTWRCLKDWEPRHPQDFVKGVPDPQVPPWVQLQVRTSFTSFCTPVTTSALPGYALPGCLLPGYVSPLFDPSLYP